MEHLTRQSDLIPNDALDMPVTILGVGAIGSFVAFGITKMGMRDVSLWDFDKVDTYNMNSQFYPFSDIGRPKVRALRSRISDYSGVRCQTNEGRYEGGKVFPGIVISAVDSMSARSMIWHTHKNQMQTKLFIDGRMSAEFGLLYAMKPMDERDQKAYEITLYTDENASQDPCTAKATIYTAMMMSGLIVKTVKDFITKSPYPRVTQWAIKEDQFSSWSSEPRKVVAAS